VTAALILRREDGNTKTRREEELRMATYNHPASPLLFFV
jgi:hypothetical protein